MKKLNSDNPKHGIIKQCPDMWSNRGQLKTMLIPEPKKINALVQSIQFGKVVIFMSNLRSRLAKDAGADIACPMTTGVFLKMLTFAAEV